MQAVTEKVKAQSQTCRNSFVSFSAFFFALPPCRQQVSAVQNAMLSTGFPSQLLKSPQQVFTWHALTALGCPYTLLGTWGTAGVHHGDRGHPLHRPVAHTCTLCSTSQGINFSFHMFLENNYQQE